MAISPQHLTRIEATAASYREAFDHVKSLLAQRTDGALPEFVFALDLLDVVAIAAQDASLARAEQQRRQWRAALHAMCELAALDSQEPDQPSATDTLDPDAFDALLGEEAAPPPETAALPGLDRFISVVQYARTAGCMYVDGGFVPVLKGGRR